MSGVHTPGPWQILEDRKLPGLIHHVAFVGDGDNTATSICTVSAEDSNGSAVRVADANAALIAAAPDLLAALARVTEFLEANYSAADMPDILPACRAAIAKAVRS